MAVVGDFTPAEMTDTLADPDEFDFCGETFEIPATVGAFALLRYGSLMKGAIAQEKRAETASRKPSDESRRNARKEMAHAEITAQAAIYELLKACLGEGQLEQFGELADRSGVNLDGLMGVAAEIQEVIGGRPTRRSSELSDGQSTSGLSSTDGGSGRTETVDLTPREQMAAEILGASTSLVASPA